MSGKEEIRENSHRIAMWAGPRNISTALMRSWGTRPDCAVSDEPLYGHYLSTLQAEKRAQHPVADEIMRSQQTDWREVIGRLTGPVPGGKAIWYQKHMAHHLTPGMDLGWIAGLTNCFLIRDPTAMITSFIKVIDNPTPADLGLPQQVELFQWLRSQTSKAPVVIDSRDVLLDPKTMLTRLCERVGVGFDEAVLSWEPGPRAEDGVWGPHWYASVYASTGFSPYNEKTDRVPDRLRGVLEECEELYGLLAGYKINAEK